MEVMQRIFERILEMRIRLENNEEFIGLAQESPLFAALQRQGLQHSIL
jgi:hypothetical protein